MTGRAKWRAGLTLNGEPQGVGSDDGERWAPKLASAVSAGTHDRRRRSSKLRGVVLVGETFGRPPRQAHRASRGYLEGVDSESGPEPVVFRDEVLDLVPIDLGPLFRATRASFVSEEVEDRVCGLVADSADHTVPQTEQP